jgi:pimeloyl-ACP methyl ester carboxylesterase
MAIDRPAGADRASPLALALQARRTDAAARGDTRAVCLDDGAVRQLLAGHEGCRELPPSLRDDEAGVCRLRVVVGYRAFAPFCSIASLTQRLQAAVEDAWGRRPEVQVFVLGNGLDVASGSAPIAAIDVEVTRPFERLVAALAGLVFEARRRDDAHFDRVALTLPDEVDGEVRLLGLDAVAAFIGGMGDALPAGAHLLHGWPLCTRRELVREVAQVAGVPVRDTTGALPVDAVGELVRLELQHATARDALGREAELVARADHDVALHAVATPAIADWRARVRAVVEPMREAYATFRAPRIDALPGLDRCMAADGSTRYLRNGTGDSALLLVHAFGLPMDVWHELARHLAPSVRVLALEALEAHRDLSSAADPSGAFIDPCYGAPDAPAGFVRAVEAVLAAEGLAACHVASWCGGSKLALELARRRPEAVASLALLAPSFAGEPAEEGAGDSAFETSLATMCQVVERMPGAATGMAKSMKALLGRGPAAPGAGGADPTGAGVFALHDAATTPWLHAPFEDAAHMVAYSRQLLAFRAHRVASGAALSGPPPTGLSMPLMLLTGELDATTNNERAHAAVAACGAMVHFSLQRAGHYFVHQNAALVADVLLDFQRHGTKTEPPHPRLRRVAESPVEVLVSGEL